MLEILRCLWQITNSVVESNMNPTQRTEQLVRQVLQDWKELEGQMLVVSELLFARLAREDRLKSDAILRLIRHHFLLAALKIIPQASEEELRKEFDEALKVLKLGEVAPVRLARKKAPEGKRKKVA